jgi:hypothetical protein
MTNPKEHAHALLDMLPEEKLTAAARSQFGAEFVRALAAAVQE